MPPPVLISAATRSPLSLTRPRPISRPNNAALNTYAERSERLAAPLRTEANQHHSATSVLHVQRRCVAVQVLLPKEVAGQAGRAGGRILREHRAFEAFERREYGLPSTNTFARSGIPGHHGMRGSVVTSRIDPLAKKSFRATSATTFFTGRSSAVIAKFALWLMHTSVPPAAHEGVDRACSSVADPARITRRDRSAREALHDRSAASPMP
jgi:hypothetical protein